MNDRRTHRTTTTDGVTIAGAVAGQGPPLVFTPGGIGDGDLDWQAVVAHLTDQFTCHLPSLRGRGLSDNHPDLRRSRLVDDLVAYVDSVGHATRLVGWSAGGMVLAVAARSDTVNAVAAIEPTMFHLLNDEERSELGATVARMRASAHQGELTAAAREFLTFPFNETELIESDASGYFEAAGRYVPTLLEQLSQTLQSPDPGPEDPEVLGAVLADVLVVYGSATKSFFAAGCRYVCEHVPNATLREVPGAGHAAPLTHPEDIADALALFFSTPHDRHDPVP